MPIIFLGQPLNTKTTIKWLATSGFDHAARAIDHAARGVSVDKFLNGLR